MISLQGSRCWEDPTKPLTVLKQSPLPRPPRKTVAISVIKVSFKNIPNNHPWTSPQGVGEGLSPILFEPFPAHRIAAHPFASFLLLPAASGPAGHTRTSEPRREMALGVFGPLRARPNRAEPSRAVSSGWRGGGCSARWGWPSGNHRGGESYGQIDLR